MENNYPYMNSIKNVDAILSKIKSAGAPPKFTSEFLKSTLGFASSNDRGIITVLKRAKFIDDGGVPTDLYHRFRSSGQVSDALAEGLRVGWSGVFLADEKVYEKPHSEVKQIFKTVSGKSEDVGYKMASTFLAIAKHADFSIKSTPKTSVAERAEELLEKDSKSNEAVDTGTLALNLSHDIHIHLPTTNDPAIYRAIFKAIKDELTD